MFQCRVAAPRKLLHTIVHPWNSEYYKNITLITNQRNTSQNDQKGTQCVFLQLQNMLWQLKNPSQYRKNKINLQRPVRQKKKDKNDFTEEERQKNKDILQKGTTNLYMKHQKQYVSKFLFIILFVFMFWIIITFLLEEVILSGTSCPSGIFF